MYQYEELYAAASKFDSTTEDRLALYEWLNQYDYQSWNGEYFDLDDGHGLYPIYEEHDGDFTVIDAEIR